MHAWDGFNAGQWMDEINVRDFIQQNYTPYDGDENFLSVPTPKTLQLWDTLEKDYLSVERKNRVYDVDTTTPASITAFPAGYISDDDNVIVGLQTDTPLKRAMMPNGGLRMVETAIKEAGKEPNTDIHEIFTKYRKTHNEAVFDVYTPEIRALRSSHVLTGLPDAYGRGRIIPEVSRVALYGIDRLIEEKENDKRELDFAPFSEDMVRDREEISEQIKALKDMKVMAAAYGEDISRPAENAREAVQWAYFGYLAAIKSQDGAAMSIGRLSPFFDVYIQRDLNAGLITEEQAQELIDNLIIKLRIVRFLRTIDYDQIFSGDPYWATWTDGGMSDDGRHQVTKTSFRLLQTLRNLGPAPEPNITILWDEQLPRGYKDFCSAISIETSAIQYESDQQIREHWGDHAAIACCVSPLPNSGGSGIQLFGARCNLVKGLLYGLNGGRDEVTGKRAFPEDIVSPYEGETLEYDKVMKHLDASLTYLAEQYIRALNMIHWSHDKYAYEAAEMALIDSHPNRVLGCGIAGLSIVTDSLSAIKYAKVTPIRDETGLIIDYKTEGDFPTYGNDDDRADDIAIMITKMFMDKIKAQPSYRNAQATQSVLTITSNNVYGKMTGATPDGRPAGTPFAPGANPTNGKDSHGVLASMLSVGKLEYQDAMDGISLTSTVIPQSIGKTKNEQVENLTNILDAAFSSGLYHTNINVLTKETLTDAMDNPDKYPNLTVRVSGYCVLWHRLTREQQLDVLSRTFHEN